MAPIVLPKVDTRVAEGGLPEKSNLVSVVIPTYNRAELVERAARSVLSQTYPDLEVIIVDDASTDNTQDRIKALQQADRRVLYICHEKNRGSQAARNTGIQAAKGGYLAFLDSDNEWAPRKLERQMVLFSQKEHSPGAVYCRYSKVSENGEVLGEYVPRHRGVVYKQALEDWLTDTSTLVIRKDILEKIHGFDENIRAYQEWDLCIRMARVCEFDFVPDSLVMYHEHNQTSISKDLLRDAHGYLSVVEKYREEILHECGKRTLSDHYLKIGRLFSLADRFDLSRTYFLKSIRCFPLNVKALMHFGISLFGKDVYRSLRAMRQRGYTSRLTG